jgi:TM2 domain-containing membrane protein YozV
MLLLSLIVALLAVGVNGDSNGTAFVPRCVELRSHQFECFRPAVDDVGSSPECTANRTLSVKCRAKPRVRCSVVEQNVSAVAVGAAAVWHVDTYPCRYVTGYRRDVALQLAVFLGPLGADRFYLGYVGLGLLKLLTFGGCTVFAMFDVVLLATGWLTPADGSDLQLAPGGPALRLAVPTDTDRFWSDVNWIALPAEP